MDVTLHFDVNGKARELTTDPDRPLLDVLREDLGLTGAKYGCGEGECGACFVLIDGRRAFSCRTPISKVATKKITTIEGIASGEALHPVQAAFLSEGAFQCGYCTAGMVIAAVALLDEKPRPTDTEIVDSMNGNLCRCCGYANIFQAVRRAAGGAK